MFGYTQTENDMVPQTHRDRHRDAKPQAASQPRPLLVALAGFTFAAALLGVFWQAEAADRASADRGKYLVNLGGCVDCHTPGYFFGKPDPQRTLGGSEVGFEIPGLGVFHGPNLTPDKETGLGTWSQKDIVTALRSGKRPDGRELAPIMPWRAFAQMTDTDLNSVALYLKTLPAVMNKVPGPFGPSEAPSSFVMKVVPPAGK
jgi:mono/diheme cytochrome c family protein